MDPGGVIMAIILLLFPVLVAVGGVVLAAILGTWLSKSAEATHEGSEFIELNR
jgi:flagellar basal body-associated protein FliL